MTRPWWIAGAIALGAAAWAAGQAQEPDLELRREKLWQILGKLRSFEEEPESAVAYSDRSFAPRPGALELSAWGWDRLLGEARYELFTIYGPHDNTDIYRLLADPRIAGSVGQTMEVVAMSGRTTAIVSAGSLSSLGGGRFRLRTESFMAHRNLCPGEDYWNQPVGASCSGFLVEEDLVATAGHCLEGPLTGKRFVWGFRMSSASRPRTVFTAKEVYAAKEVVSLEKDGNRDFALVRLARKVELPGVEPAPRRSDGQVRKGDPLYLLGHPSGLPLKYAGNASVTDEGDSDHFLASLDAFGGNSGSMVVNAATGLVEGILTSGGRDYEMSTPTGCNVLFRCTSEDDCAGEVVTRIGLLQPPRS